MIIIDEFKKFLFTVFPSSLVYLQEFKEDLQFVDIDCFEQKAYKLTIELTPEKIKVATISKKAELDFSLYDYVFDNEVDAKRFILQVKAKGDYPFLS